MLNLIFDGTVLLNNGKKDAARSGIFFVCKNLYDQFREKKELKVCVYFSPERMPEAIEFLKENKDLECVNIFREKSFSLRLNLWLWKVHGRLYKYEYIRKPFALGIILSQKILKWVNRNGLKSDLLNQSAVFFSPAKEIPSAIRKYEHLEFWTVLHDAIPLISRYMGFIEPHIYKKLIKSFGPKDHFFCVSQNTKNDYLRLTDKVTEGNSYVVPLAASSCFTRNTDAECFAQVCTKYGIKSKKYVFSLCTLEPRKNLIRAIRTFLIFVKKNQIQDLVWVLGGGHWEHFVELLQQEIGQEADWQKYICRIGYVDDCDLPILYSNAEWFVYTSQYEGFGLPPLEAMQCGCPVITSNNSSLPEVVGGVGILIDWDSDEQHVAAYEKYYFDVKLREANSRNGIERAKQFSWKKTVERMIIEMTERTKLS